jgi:hypothetical protein
MARKTKLYKGNNKQGTASLFRERRKYKNFALVQRNFKKPLGAKIEDGVADFSIGALCLYGRVDKDNDVVLLNRSGKNLKRIKPLPTMKSTRSAGDPGDAALKAINFVADAFHQFMRELVKAQKVVCNGVSPEDIKIEVIRALVHPADIYGEYMLTAFAKSFGNFLTRNPRRGLPKKLRDEVVTFEQYVDKLVSYMEYAGVAVPITKVGFVNRLGSIAATGLSVEMRDANPSLDVKKEEFLNEKMFDLYKKAANKHGFVVDKSMPWRLVADINSSAMQKYMAKYEVTVDNFFETYYTKMHRLDFFDLANTCYRLWNNYVDVAPSFRKKINTNCNTGKIIVEKVTRQRFNDFEQFSEKYNYRYWISVTTKIRNSELGRPFKGVQLDRIISHAQQLYEAKGHNSATDYINGRLKDEALKQTINEERLKPSDDTANLWAELGPNEKIVLQSSRASKFTPTE